ncbi:MAG TPA: MFS transporter [Cyclobacteriaceae bacterium]|nr:MFS transporter [Cyclobacteriaceae bacterium]
MSNWKIKLSLFLNYFVFAILLNSVGTVILQVQNNYGVSESSASILEAFKDLSIAIVSFLIASYITRIGYRRAMLFALGFVGLACLLMPSLGSFAMTKVLFAVTGTSFALIKVSVYATIGIVTKDKKEHASFMNFIESFFMIGILTGYFIFSAFVDDRNAHSTQWLDVYYLLAGIALVAFVLLLGAPLDESQVKIDSAKPFLEDFAGMIKLAITPLVLVFIMSAFTYVLIEQSIMSWLPTFNSKVLNLPATLSIQMASILAASTAVGRFSAGFALRKIHWFMVLVVCLLSAGALVLVAIPLARAAGGHEVTGWGDAPLGAFVFPLIGLFISPIYPAINSVILSTLPARQHGPMSGLIVIFSALGGTTGSIITGNIFQAFGGQTAFYFSLVPITILLICLFFFNRLQKKSEAKVGFTAKGGH